MPTASIGACMTPSIWYRRIERLWLVENREPPMIKATPFDYPYDGRLVAENTALVVIDLQQDFLSTTGYFAKQGYDPSPLRAILPTVNRLISAARGAGVRIIHTRQGYRADMA